MRLSLVLLAVILFLWGLGGLGLATISGHLMDWLLIADAILLILEPVLPDVPVPWKQAD